ncbi:MAG: hypothetical protein NC131_07165 [Roseburia sp.]|nr:hypothetical protein [Roseburia sp.]
MHGAIKYQIDNIADINERRLILDTIEQLDNGNGQSIEFYSDGSGVCFTIKHPTINHGCPGTVARSFRTEYAMLILAGHRLTSHELPKCC